MKHLETAKNKTECPRFFDFVQDLGVPESTFWCLGAPFWSPLGAWGPHFHENWLIWYRRGCTVAKKVIQGPSSVHFDETLGTQF